MNRLQCNRLKLTAADSKKRLTDVADTEQVLRLIQSIPSKKAVHFTTPPDELPLPKETDYLDEITSIEE